MSQQPEQNPERNSSIDTLEGGWLRKERERIAIGRKALATKLGSTESRVHTIEWRRQPVPVEWLPILRSLAFRIPFEDSAATVSANEQSAPHVVAAPVPVPPAPAAESVVVVPVVVVPSVMESPAREVTAAVTEAVVVDAQVVTAPIAAEPASVTVVSVHVEEVQTPAAAAPVPAAVPVVIEAAVVDSAAAPAEVQAVDVTAAEVAPSTLSQREPPSSNPAQPTQLYHGRWLRERRYEKAVRMQTLIQKLQSSEAELYALERHNIRLPLRWIPRLLKIGLLTLEEAKAASRLPRMSQLDGIWLERQRALLKMTPDELGKNLHVSGADIRLVESRAWLVPSEWFPKLTTLLEERRAAKAKAKALADAAKAEQKAGLKKPAPSSLSIKSDKSALSDKVDAKAVSKAESKQEAKTESRSVKTEAPAATKTETKSDSKAESKVSASRGGTSKAVGKDATQSLAEAVVAHRLRLGQHAKQPAIEVLGLIAQDLRLALGSQTIGYDALADSLRALLRR